MGKHSLLGPNLIYKTLEKVHIIRNQLQMAYSWQKSYVGIGDGIWSFNKVIKCT